MHSSPEPGAFSGGRLPEALFLVFRLESHGANVCLLALLEQSALGTSSPPLPPDLALLRSAFFFTGALFFARMALSRCAFHGFQMNAEQWGIIRSNSTERGSSPSRASAANIQYARGKADSIRHVIEKMQKAAEFLDRQILSLRRYDAQVSATRDEESPQVPLPG